MKTKFCNHSVRTTLKSILSSNQEFRIHIKPLMKLYDSLVSCISNNGKEYTIHRIKSLRTIVFNYVGRDAGKPNARISLNKHGIPKCFNALQYNVKVRDKSAIRGILTVLQLSYIIDFTKEPDFTQIEAKSQFDPKGQFASRFGEFLRDDLNQALPGLTSFMKSWGFPHTSFSSGPNGHAMTSAHLDLKALDASLISDLKILGGRKFAWFIDMWTANPDTLEWINNQTMPRKDRKKLKKDFSGPAGKVPLLRKLSAIDSPEGKCRIIAIFDYWSQSVLKPLHDWSFDNLRRIPMDCTFNQGSNLHKMKKGPFYSFDLKGATDRFPIGIQRMFLERVIGKERADAWKNILVDRPFVYESKQVRTSVTYSVGQPMGAYSSWGIFALCHHLIVQMAAKMVGESLPFRDYSLLGDDIVICNAAVAEKYLNIMTSQLDVEISKTKSLVSQDTFEFAKRIFYQGEEMTAFPLAAVHECYKDVTSLWSVMAVARERGYDFVEYMKLPVVVKSLWEAHKISSLRLQSLSKRVKLLDSLAILAREHPDRYDEEWAIETACSSLNLFSSCNMSLSTKGAMLSQFLGHQAACFKSEKLEECKNLLWTNSSKLSRHKTMLYSNQGDEGQPMHRTQVRNDLSPVLWALQCNIVELQQDRHDLYTLAGLASYKELIRMTARPLLRVDRLMSRTLNVPHLARSKDFIAYVAKSTVMLAAERNDAMRI